MTGLVLYKMSGSGNDFIVADGRSHPVSTWTADQIRDLCARRTGIGADGFVVLEPGSIPGAVRFQYFNSDGGRTTMCGNAALCATRLAAWLRMAPPEGMVLETDAGSVPARCVPGPGERAEIDLPDTGPVGTPAIPLDPGEEGMRAVEVGVPHLVVRVRSLAAVPVRERGAALRRHRVLGPAGANVNFVAREGATWGMRTYERGVEDETLACGTGAVAVAAALLAEGEGALPLAVRTRSGARLTVSGTAGEGGGIARPGLEGEGRLVFRAVLGA